MFDLIIKDEDLLFDFVSGNEFLLFKFFILLAYIHKNIFDTFLNVVFVLAVMLQSCELKIEKVILHKSSFIKCFINFGFHLRKEKKNKKRQKAT